METEVVAETLVETEVVAETLVETGEDAETLLETEKDAETLLVETGEDAETLVETEKDAETLVVIVDVVMNDAIRIVGKMTGIVNVGVEETNVIETAPMGKPTNVIGRHGENAQDMLTTGVHAQFNHAVIKVKIETTKVKPHDSRRTLS